MSKDYTRIKFSLYTSPSIFNLAFYYEWDIGRSS